MVPRVGPAPVPVIRRQANMTVVLAAVAPCAAAAIYFYGWRALAILVLTNLSAFAAEWFFTRRRGEPVTEAAFVTGTLLALTLPPHLPLWMCIPGAVFGIVFGKELFGGMGRNVFNPALVGRAFLFLSFPREMTGAWVQPFSGGLAGLTAWTPALPVDAASRATPLKSLAAGAGPDLLSLLLGARAGCLGEGAALLILLGAALLLYRRVASWEIMASTAGSYLLFALAFSGLGVGAHLPPLEGLFAGGLLFGTVFMATDPVSACPTRPGKFAFGVIIGITAAGIRFFGNFPEGAMFAILVGNTLGPITETGLTALLAQRAAKKEAS